MTGAAQSNPQSFEVGEPIINSPFKKPEAHWYIREGELPQKLAGRRPAIVYPPREQRREWDLSDGTLERSKKYPAGYEMKLVNAIRERVDAWRAAGWPGVTRTTHELLQWWRREGREKPLFFAQLEAVETIVFMREARADYLQGIEPPMEELSGRQSETGAKPFRRYACKMATGSGKTTVMGMLAAWSILNKVNDRSDARFSDVVLIVCPNVTIRNRLDELDPERGEASLYRTRDLAPADRMPLLRRGKVLVTNWHVFEPQAPGNTEGAKVSRCGVPIERTEWIKIGKKTTTARGSRYLTLETYEQQLRAGMLEIVEEKRDKKTGELTRVKVKTTKYVESDTGLIERVLGKEIGGKKNLLVINDEAHHAYRIKREEDDEDEGGTADEGDTFGEDEDADEFYREATVWVEGLDRIQRHRGINFCLDLSATPYFLGRVGQDTNRPFPWVVSDFGLIDAIESGLVKIPQLAVRDESGAEIPGYFNIWRWMLEDKMTPAEKGGARGNPKPEAVLKYAHHPIAMLGGLWETLRAEWSAKSDDPRPPVFIFVCKNTRIAKVLYEWIAEDKAPANVAPCRIEGFRNRNGEVVTIRVDSKVVNETDTGSAKSDETRWMRLTLDTVGKTDWPKDRQGRSIYPEDFEKLAAKLGRPLHPPGRDVRCIVSVGMLTEGWDCNTVTHIIGLRPFMSQLLCEQVVGRGLRRASYDLTEEGLFSEEVAKVFGVPFEVIPFKADSKGKAEPVKRHHVHAIPEKAQFEIRFPRVEGFTQAIRNRLVVDWDSIPTLRVEPDKIPPEVEVKALNIDSSGRPSLLGPGRLDEVGLRAHRETRREQELAFDFARTLTREYIQQRECELAAHVLFPRLLEIVLRYLREKVVVIPPSHLKDVFLAPYFGWIVERLIEAIRPDPASGDAPEIPRYEMNRGPGSTEAVDFWTSKEVRPVVNSHLNYVVADTKRWEQSAAVKIDKHEAVEAFVKNQGLGFAIPYFHNGEPHEYVPDFIIRLKAEGPLHLILETKGFDELEEIKTAAARRWVDAVNAEGSYGRWEYRIARKPGEVADCIRDAAKATPSVEMRLGPMLPSSRLPSR